MKSPGGYPGRGRANRNGRWRPPALRGQVGNRIIAILPIRSFSPPLNFQSRRAHPPASWSGASRIRQVHRFLVPITVHYWIKTEFPEQLHIPNCMGQACLPPRNGTRISLPRTCLRANTASLSFIIPGCSRNRGGYPRGYHLCQDHRKTIEHSRRKIMGLKSDGWIRKMALEHKMIDPFTDRQKRDGVISYGLSSYGYDIRVADEFKVFTNVYSAVVDPKNFERAPWWISRGRCASSRPTPSPWPAGWNTSASRARCSPSAWAKAPTPAAGSSSTSPPSSRSGRVSSPSRSPTPPPAGEDLLQRGHRPGAVLRGRRALPDLLRG